MTLAINPDARIIPKTIVVSSFQFARLRCVIRRTRDKYVGISELSLNCLGGTVF